MSDKIKLLNTGDKDEMATAIGKMKRQMPLLIEHAVILAEIRKASYDAHIAKGFSPEQALELCKIMV